MYNNMASFGRNSQNADTPFRRELREDIRQLLEDNKSFFSNQLIRQIRREISEDSLTFTNTLINRFNSLSRVIGDKQTIVEQYIPTGLRVSRKNVRGTNRKFASQIFQNNRTASLSNLVTAIMRRVEQSGEQFLSIRLRYIDEDGNLSIKNLPKSVLEENTREEIEEILRTGNPQIIGEGSNSYEILTDIDVSYFTIDTLNFNFRGGDIKNIKHKNKKVKNIINDTILCENFKSKDKNCLLEILRNITDTKTKANKIRDTLKIERNTDISINQIPLVEEYFNKKISVIISSEIKKTFTEKGEEDNFTFKNINKFRCSVEYIDTYIYGDTEADITLFLRDNHYTLCKRRAIKYRCYISGLGVRKAGDKANHKEIITELKERGLLTTNKVKIEKKKKKGNKYWFFDYETIYSLYSDLKPYSVAVVVGSEVGGKFVEENRFFDLSDKCNENFLEFLFTNRSREYNNILVGYNSSRFDNYILAGQLIKDGLLGKNSIMFAGNSMLKLYFDSFKCIDLCRFTMTSLSNACKGFKCDIQKSPFNHKDIQDIYFNNPQEFFNNMEEKRDDVEFYNVNDCLSLADLYFKFKNKVKELTNLELEDFNTISQLTYKFWENNFKECLPPKDLDTWNFFRSSVVAGRSQIFKKGFTDKNIQSMDVKSLYPYVMIFKSFPIGQEIETDSYQEGKLGIYKCIIKKQPTDNIIPLRQKGTPLNWKYQDDIECVISSVDIENIRDFGGVVEVGAGYYWEESSKEVFKCLEKFMNEKNQQDYFKERRDDRYNPALRSTLKLLMNSLSGKVIQRIFSEDKQLFYDDKDIIKFLSEHKNYIIEPVSGTNALYIKGTKKEIKYPKKARPNYLGVFIYAYARTHMYKSVISKIEDKYGMDTDSLHAPVEEFNKLRQQRGFGEYYEAKSIDAKFGDFEGELNFRPLRSYYIAPKCYGIFGEEKCKMKFKGVGSRDRLCNISAKQFKKLDIQEQYEIYNKSKPALCEDLYKRLVEKEEVGIICSQIKRDFILKNGDITSFGKMRQVFTVKTIKG